MSRPTGAIASPRHVLAAAAPHRILGATPAQWCRIPKTLSYWKNDVDGDCVTAEEAFNKACSGILISDSVVLAWAGAHNALNGAVISEVLDWMARQGFSQDGNLYDDGSKASVDYTNDAQLQNAIYQGPVKIGVAAAQLQQSVSQSNGWFGLNFSRDANLDHCVALSGYGSMGWLAQQLGVTVPAGVDGNAPGYHLFTWNTIGVIDVPSMRAITGEAWSRTPPTIIDGTGTPTPDVVVTPPGPDPGPTPTPTPTPTPVPGITLQQVLAAIDGAFAVAEKAFKKTVWGVVIVPALVYTNKYVDQVVAKLWTSHNIRMAVAGSGIPWQQLIKDEVNTALDWLEQYESGDVALVVKAVRPIINRYLDKLLGG